MKKCPFCKADIEDNARFCLYCMKPLNEKETILPPQRKMLWWPFVLAAILLIVLLSVLLFMPEAKVDLPAESTDQTTGEQTVDTTGESTQAEPSLDESQNDSGGSGTKQDPIQPQNTTQTQPEDTTENLTPVQPDIPTQDTTPPTGESTSPEETTEPPTQNTVEETTAATTEPDAPKAEVVYAYRAARAGDDFNAQYQNAGSDIVITGILQPSASGVYDIPSYIDGKKVIAIVANAFSGSNAKTVFIPATVKTIWNYAFAGCGLTDIYFRGNSIYVESKAFDRSIIIHCSASCSDRNFRYYKNCAASYGATWAEWNG